MSAPIGPGDWVECVDAAPRDYADVRLTLGAIYQVHHVADLGPWGLGVWLTDNPSASWSGGYHADRFRPIYTPKQELIETLKAPPRRMKEDA